MGNFGHLTAFYVRLLASRCLPAEPASTPGVTRLDGSTFAPQTPMDSEPTK